MRRCENQGGGESRISELPPVLGRLRPARRDAASQTSGCAERNRAIPIRRCGRRHTPRRNRARRIAGLLAVGFWVIAHCAFAIVPWTLLINTNHVVNVLNYGAVGDGVTTNTTAIQNAINAAAAGGVTNGLSGGTVEIPGPGVYLCGPLTMKSAVNLQIDAGAILRMLPYDKYPGGIVNPPNFIGATNLHDVEISGAGAIDGQGAPWWPGYKTNNRPIMIRFQGCTRQLIQGVTLSNSPMFHISISSSKGNATVQGVTIIAPPSSGVPNPSHNTDACDVSGTNVLVQNCYISVGDDDFTCSGGTHDVLLTNNTYGNGHGISIGSYTSGGVSNITVINCTINGADNGLRIKSDNDRGGLVQNIAYLNIGMTNVHFPIQLYAYYNEFGTPGSITPAVAAAQPVAPVTGTTPIYRNILYSNITATSVSGYPVGIIWARTEMPATNIVFDRVRLTGDESFDLYNVSGAQFVDCNFTVNALSNTFLLFDAQVTLSNRAPAGTLFTFDGLTTNDYGNSLAFYNARGALQNTNALDRGPLTLSAGTFTVSNNLTLFPNSAVNFILGTNPAMLAVTGNLTLGGTNNIFAGAGFTNGTYTLMTCGGTLSGSPPALGLVPAGYNYFFDTNIAGQVKLVIAPPAPDTPANLRATPTNLLIRLNWSAAAQATGYLLKRSTNGGGLYAVIARLATTNYADADVWPGTTYYYTVSATNTAGASADSAPVSAAPLPSDVPTNLMFNLSGTNLQLAWPPDHRGWQLQIQTNDLRRGLGTNWVTAPDSTNSTQFNLPLNPTNGSVFLRLIYP